MFSKYDEISKIISTYVNDSLLRPRADASVLNQNLQNLFGVSLSEIDITNLTNAIDSAKSARSDWQNGVNNEISMSVTDWGNALEKAKDLVDKKEGYARSVKSLLQAIESNSSLNKGVHGVLANLISVDSKYETAMETALGGSIQNIVTKDEATAKKMVEYLKTNKFGRATFLPLTSITVKALGQTQDAAAKEQGVIGYANTLVHVAKEYECQYIKA